MITIGGVCEGPYASATMAPRHEPFWTMALPFQHNEAVPTGGIGKPVVCAGLQAGRIRHKRGKIYPGPRLRSVARLTLPRGSESKRNRIGIALSSTAPDSLVRRGKCSTPSALWPSLAGTRLRGAIMQDLRARRPGPLPVRGRWRWVIAPCCGAILTKRQEGISAAAIARRQSVQARRRFNGRPASMCRCHGCR
jgi:hypothetical protein